MTLYDMHCHLDFASHGERIAAQMGEASIKALSCTIMPSSYVSDLEKFEGAIGLYLSLGIHPWWVAEKRVGEADLARFESLLPTASFVGEIGLDFSGKHKLEKTKQLEVLQRLLDALNQAGNGRVISLHSVHATTLLLDMLDSKKTTQSNTCIFHSFNGSHEEFGRAIATQSYFSVGMRLLASSKGELFASAIPDDQLLIETDNPPHEGDEWGIEIWKQELENTLSSLARVRNVNKGELKELLRAPTCKPST